MLPETPYSPIPTFAEAHALAERFAEAVRDRRDAELRCAAVLAELEQRQGLSWLACASVGELGERSGLAAEEARGLCDLGKALPQSPLLEQKVRDGQIPVRTACCVSRVLANPALLRDEDDWIGWALAEPVRRVERRVRRRLEEARAGDEPVVPLQLYVRARARDQFQRAREVASQKAARALTTGETFETVVDHYLDSFDVDRVAPGERRVEHTTHVAGRYIPMAVRREIYERQGHACAVPFCEHTLFLEHAHIVAHASGGSREADNLVLLCSLHHLFLDTGYLRLAGTAAKPLFFDDRGRDFGARYQPGGAYSFWPAPEPAVPADAPGDPPAASPAPDADRMPRSASRRPPPCAPTAASPPAPSAPP